MTIDEMIDVLTLIREQIEDTAGLSREAAGAVEVRAAHQPRHPIHAAILASAALKLDGAWIAMLGLGREEYGGGDVWDRDGEIVDVDAEQDARDAEIDADCEGEDCAP